MNTLKKEKPLWHDYAAQEVERIVDNKWFIPEEAGKQVEIKNQKIDYKIDARDKQNRFIICISFLKNCRIEKTDLPELTCRLKQIRVTLKNNQFFKDHKEYFTLLPALQ